MKTSSFLLSCIIISSCITACSPSTPNEPPLTKDELSTLVSLQKEYDQKKKRVEAYKDEVKRIKALTNSYTDNHLSLLDFSLYKSNRFEDRLERLCFQGQLFNSGNEVVENLDLQVELNDHEGNSIVKWKTPLVSANDHLIDRVPNDDIVTLALAISGRKLPLGPNETKDFSSVNRCMDENYKNWEEENVTYNLTNLRLRAKLEEIDSLSLVRISAKLSPLKSRAKTNHQIP